MSFGPVVNYATKPRQVETEISNIFDCAIGSSAPNFAVRSHTLQPKSIPPCSVSGKPIQTNKFYANFLLGTQKSYVYALPYTLKWSGEGLDIGHTDEGQQVFGPDPQASETQYFFCPVGIVAISLSASERPTLIELSELDQFSVVVELKSATNFNATIVFNIVRGSAFISACYKDLTPIITSNVMFRNTEAVTISTTVRKWRLLLEDGTIWLVYACGSKWLELEVVSNRELRCRYPWSGLLQVAKMPNGDSAVENLFDYVAGSYPVAIHLEGRITNRASYEFEFKRSGQQPVLMYALPHHVASFEDRMSSRTFRNYLASQTNGMMTLVWSNEWWMQEALPLSTQLVSCRDIPTSSRDIIEAALREDIKQDFESQIRADSMYFCGKALNKLAQVTILSYKLQSDTFPALLARLESNLLYFARNQQQYGLIYENTWGGLVSSQGFTSNGDGSDFGNTWYNDHHYHYGYHIGSAAIFLELGPSSPYRNEIESWARALVRDVASPTQDSWFCAYRCMDWFVGHSWSKGLYESTDGKDEESSSEDYHLSYAIYLFAQVTGDQALADRAKVQIAVQSSSINHYMLFSPDNVVVPGKILRNCVSGIKFENKIDYVRVDCSPDLRLIHGRPLTLAPTKNIFMAFTFYRSLRSLHFSVRSLVLGRIDTDLYRQSRIRTERMDNKTGTFDQLKPQYAAWLERHTLCQSRAD